MFGIIALDVVGVSIDGLLMVGRLELGLDNMLSEFLLMEELLFEDAITVVFLLVIVPDSGTLLLLAVTPAKDEGGDVLGSWEM